MFISDELGTIKGLTAPAERMFGYANDEAIGLNIGIMLHDPTRHESATTIDFSRHSAATQCGERAGIVYARRRSGGLVPIELDLGEIHDGSHRLITGHCNDISERLAAESRLADIREELKRVSRLGAVGELAVALAHELNQPLAAAAYFIGAADRVLAEDANREQGRDLLRLGGEQVLRGAEIIRRMRAFAATGAVDMRDFSIRTVIKDAVATAFLGDASGAITVSYDFDHMAEMVIGDRIQIGQVVANLVRNAIEELHSHPVKSRHIMIATKALTPEITQLSVTDSGPGIDPQVMSTLFQPFVSTKPNGGMGVGLAICERIVRAHGGTIEAANPPSGGAELRFTLRRSPLSITGVKHDDAEHLHR